MIEEILFTIEGLLLIGFIMGALVAYFLSQKIGCAALITIPIIMLIYIDWWLNNNPDSTSSTSALAYIFVPLWPSMGAIAGYFAVNFIKSRYKNLDE